MEARDDWKDEYKDLSDNMRHYGSMRFAQLTLFSAWTAALMSAAMTTEPSHWLRVVAIKLLGLAVALVFFVLEFRSTKYWKGYLDRAKYLERRLDYRQYRDSPSGRGRVTSSRAIVAFFCMVLLFWLSWLLETWIGAR